MPLLMLVLLGAAAGCSGQASVNGNVELDGKPIDGGTISFIPTGNSKAATSWGRIEEGLYSIPASKGPEAGMHRVEIRWPRKTGKKVRALPPASPAEVIEEVREAVPGKYNAQSELKADIKRGANTFDFELWSR